MHYLGSDIRGKTPEQLAAGRKAGAQVVGSYDAIRWVPEAEVIPPGIDVGRDRAGAAGRPHASGDRPRALVAPPQGHRARDRGRGRARRRPRARRGPAPRRGLRALPRRGRRRRPAQRRLVRRVRDRGDGARQAGRDLPPRRGRAAHGGGVRHPRPARPGDEGDAARGAAAARRRRRRSAGAWEPRAAPTSSACTTSSGSPTACSRSTLASSHAGNTAEAARGPVRDLRPRRDRLPPHRRLPAPDLHALPRPDRPRRRRRRRRAHGGARDDPPRRDLERLLPLHLRLARPRAPPHGAADVVLVHDGRRHGRPRRRAASWPSRSGGCSGSTTRRSSAPPSSASGRR